MSDEENIEESPEDGKTERPKEVKETPKEQPIESTEINQSDIHKSEIQIEVPHHSNLPYRYAEPLKESYKIKGLLPLVYLQHISR